MADNKRGVEKAEDALLPTILVLATDGSVRKMLEMALKVEYGGEVLPCASVWSALEESKRFKPDLIVIYYQLLGMKALDLVDQLHRIEGIERIPIILTHVPVASGSENQSPQCIVLSQPFVLEDLYAAIQTCLCRI